jgi:hypothetical protein
MRLAYPTDGIPTLAPGKVKAVLDKDRRGDFLLAGRLGKSDWRRLSYG